VLVHVELSGSAKYTVPLLCGIMMSESASQRDTTDSVRLLLQAGAAPDATFIDHAQEEQNALLIACNLLGDLTIVQILLAAGVDPCYQTSTGASALHRAVVHGHASLCRALVAASSGRALELEVANGRLTPLIAACAYKQEAVAELLCTLGADVSHADSHGFAALAAAANEGCSVSLLRILLQQRGVNINGTDNKGNTAVALAAGKGDTAAVKLLLEHGADASIKNLRGQCAMFAATGKGHLHIVHLLLQHGLSIYVTDSLERTLLIETTRGGAEHVAEFLIQQGVSVHATDARQHTALHVAAMFSEAAATVQLLLQHGADVNARAEENLTPLHRAASALQLQNAKLLLAAGADVCLSNDEGMTPLRFSILKGDTPLVKLLLEHGAAAVADTMQVHVSSCCGPVSALMDCIDTAILKLLLGAGADVHAVTSRGDTCLHVAARHSYPVPVLCLLIKAGADMHAVNDAGKTAAQVAHDSGHTLIEQLLNRAAQG
jgi:ankyrin repeat protein